MEQIMYGTNQQDLLLNTIGAISPGDIAFAVSLFALVMIWAFVWKGIALWKAAQNNSVPWFVGLLLVNTLGILEIIYIFIISKKQTDATNHKKTKEEILQDAVIEAELKKMKEEVKTESEDNPHIAAK